MYEYKCEIVRVVDGDTVDVDIDLGFGVWMRNERVRLHGIDTPESRTRDGVEKIFGKLASSVVTHFLPHGSTQILVTVKDNVGKYGRVLGKFKIHDLKNDAEMFLNDWLIREHYAVAYTGQSKGNVQDTHLENYQKLFEIPTVEIPLTQEEFDKYINSMRNNNPWYD